MNIPVYNQNGEKTETLEISNAVFAVEPKSEVIYQATVAQRANARVAIAHTKNRGDVRGGGKKPWKQKGTGNARQGSIRAPQWRGGGIVFGPRSDRNYSQKVNKKMRRAAILMALSDKASLEHIFVLQSLEMSEPKTKSVAKIIAKLPLKKGKTMLALSAKDKNIGKLAKNLPKIMPIWVGSLNVVDLLYNTNLVTTVEGIKEMEKVYQQK